MRASITCPCGRSLAVAARARTARERARGLIGRPPLRRGDGLILERAAQVHTFGVRASIDVVFCDAHWVVLHVVRSLPPRRVTRRVAGSRYAIELPAGVARCVRGGDRLIVTPATAASRSSAGDR